MCRLAALMLLVVGSACGCKQDAATSGTSGASGEQGLLAEARRALAERDRRLTSYHVTVASKEGGAEGLHEVFFRAPNRVRGVVSKPVAQTLAFDGSRFYKLSVSEKNEPKLEVFEMKLPVDKAAYFLASTFDPLVPEGYRTPLLPMKGVSAKKVTHPKGPDAVELSVSPSAETSVTFVMRFPSLDLLEKRTTSGGATETLLVEDEWCDAALKLCVPKAVSTRSGGQVVYSMTMSDIALNPELPNDGFTLTAPAGTTPETHQLVEAP